MTRQNLERNAPTKADGAMAGYSARLAWLRYTAFGATAG